MISIVYSKKQKKISTHKHEIRPHLPALLQRLLLQPDNIREPLLGPVRAAALVRPTFHVASIAKINAVIVARGALEPRFRDLDAAILVVVRPDPKETELVEVVR